MQEHFLHFLWRTRRFDLSHLRTTQGDPIAILDWGAYNTHAGPDFLHARLRIGDTLWAGHVEMHLKASEWMRHKHQFDEAYRNVVLHVVLEEDEPVLLPGGERLPCLELKQRIPARLTGEYLKLLHSANWIPCQNLIREVPDLPRKLWLDRLVVERLELRTGIVARIYAEAGQDWDETCYRLLARYLGAKVNMDPFEALAQITPLRLLQKYRNNLFRMEALLFGQAGMLNRDFLDPYPLKLKSEYDFLRKKHQLQPLAASQWKFLRMRPASFPTLRIAQLAALIFQTDHLFSKILALQQPEEVAHMLEVKLSNYWQKHFLFDKETSPKVKTLGRDAVFLLLINAIVPLMFFVGQQRANQALCDRALQLLQSAPPENNSIIQGWQKIGFPPISASDSQALLQLKQYYCDSRRCLECVIGAAILK
jgi:hypothetical protein